MSDRPEQERVRFEKLKDLRGRGFSYPNTKKIEHSALDILNSDIPETPESGSRYSLAGRVVQLRLMGKAAFLHLLDGSAKAQIYLRMDELGEEIFQWINDLDLGDIIWVSGYPFLTKTGEKTLHCENFELLSKALIPLPEKWHGLTDVEARYRYRYVDLIANPEVRETFKVRAKILSFVRRFLDSRGFLEVETPVLHYIPGGATARPFKTHHNTLGTDMYLRIALELPLKKLIAGGLERVYEIGKNFRNEGVSRKHNPEFTMLEFYQAYATFHDLMDLTEEFFKTLAMELFSKEELTYDGKVINLKSPWKRISMADSVREIGGVSSDLDLYTLSGVKKAAESHKVHLEEPEDWGMCLEALWDELVEPRLIDPTFITHHPYSISPLARRNDENPNITDRFELIIAGMEMANAFSELNDPVDQRERFEAQASRKANGDEEASDVDEDFLRALEYGLPPTAGEGIGIDRLVMLFTDSHSIRDVVLFPQLKRLEEDAS